MCDRLVWRTPRECGDRKTVCVFVGYKVFMCTSCHRNVAPSSTMMVTGTAQ